MQESYFVNKWTGEAAKEATQKTLRETLRGAVRSVLASRGVDPIPPEITAALDGQSNPDVLNNWLKGAATSSTASDFLAFIQTRGTTGS